MMGMKTLCLEQGGAAKGDVNGRKDHDISKGVSACLRMERRREGKDKPTR